MPQDRRSFLELSIFGLGAIIGGALAVPAVGYLFSRKSNQAQTDWIDVGDASRIPQEEPLEVLFRRKRVDGWKVLDERTSAWVSKDSNGEIVALAPGCTHLGCAYHWVKDKKEFLCPCHTSTFSLDGKVTAGPAPRALDRYQARVVNGKLQLGEVEVSEG